MTVPASRYIHLASIGSRADCLSVGHELAPWLKSLLAAQEIDGFDVVLVNSHEGGRRSILWGDFEPIAQGRFPFLYVAVQELSIEPKYTAEMLRLGFAAIPMKDRL